MGLDLFLYNTKHKDVINFEEDDSRCLYWRGERNLHYLLVNCGKPVENEEGRYIIKKNDILKLVSKLVKSAMKIFTATINAEREYTDVDSQMVDFDSDNDDHKLYREYYVISRMLRKSIIDEMRKSDYNSVSLFDSDYDGSEMEKLINGLLELINNMDDNDTLTYVASY